VDFIRYSEDVKGYIVIQPHSNEIIIKIDVNFDENLLSCEPNSAFVPSSARDPSFGPILVYSTNDDSEDESPPLPAHLPPDDSIDMNLHQHHHFPDGSIQYEKHRVIFLEILHINVVLVHSSRKPPLFWLKILRLMIHTHLHKLLSIHIGT
jgi:hypothetical protein